MSSLAHDMVNGTHNGRKISLYVVDTETTMRKTHSELKGKPFSADPYHKDNYILCMYAAAINLSTAHAGLPPKVTTSQQLNLLGKGSGVSGLVAHNAKFDLAYLRRAGVKTTNFPVVYDTQVMFYILTGRKMVSLNEALLHYDLPQKFDSLAAHIALGGTTETMNQRDLREYLRQDVVVTGELFSEMMRRATEKQKRLFNIQARVTPALFEMEWNGLHFNNKDIAKLSDKVDDRLVDLTARMQNGLTFKSITVDDIVTRFTTSTGKHIEPHPDADVKGVDLVAAFHDYHESIMDNFATSATYRHFIYGEPYKMQLKIPIGHYKNGKIKTKLHDVLIDNRACSLLSTYTIPMTDSGKETSTSAGTLRAVSAELKDWNNTTKAGFTDDLLEYREMSKLRGTYLQPLAIMKKESYDGIVHPTLNQCNTSTGRLSSARPNSQNNPEIVNELYTNRYDESYGIIDADFKQLEMFAAGYIYNVPTLMADLQNGVDIHDMCSKQLNRAGITRKEVKRVVFSMLYGSTPKGSSVETGYPLQACKDIQDWFFTRYEGLGKARNDYYDKMKQSSGTYDPHREKFVYCDDTSETGRSYWYPKEKGWNGQMEWPFTKSCNYRLQGWATGDIVPMYIAMLHMYKFYYDEKEILKDVIFNNTVHDSIKAEGNFSKTSVSNTNVRQLLSVLASDYIPKVYEVWTGKKLPFKLTLDF